MKGDWVPDDGLRDPHGRSTAGAFEREDSHFRSGWVASDADAVPVYPNLWAYTRDLYQQPGVSRTVNLPLAKMHYYGSHSSINPHGIVASTTPPDFTLRHNRKCLT